MYNKSRSYYRFALLVVFGLLTMLPTLAQTPSSEEIVTKVNEYMSAAEKVDRFSGTVLVAKDGKPIFSKGYGMANREWDIPNTPQTAFRLGSITKQFTAVSILQLMEAGKLNLNDAITKFIPDYPMQGQTITIEHLLTHTSGIQSYTGMKDFIERLRMDLSPSDMVDHFKNEPMEFAPGEKFHYNNSG